MDRKRRKHGQDRCGSAARRRLEFAVLVDQVKRNKQRLITRLSARVVHLDNGCIEYRATMDHKGYPRINFRHKGQHVTIPAHKLFAMLITRKPIPLGMEVDHECKNRRCVKHLRLKHYTENAADVKKAEPCPF